MLMYITHSLYLYARCSTLKLVIVLIVARYRKRLNWFLKQKPFKAQSTKIKPEKRQTIYTMPRCVSEFPLFSKLGHLLTFVDNV